MASCNLVFLLAAGISFAAAPMACGQTNYPTRHVTIIAPAAPGGNPDILARVMSMGLRDKLHQPFTVENVPGAGGVVAATNVSQAKPDGYTLLTGDSGAFAINPALMTAVAYDPVRDFTPITALATVPTVLVVPSSVPANTLAEFVAYVKANQGKPNYGSAGNGSVHHITMAVFLARAGIAMPHIPYRGGTGLVSALLKGEVQAGWSGIPNVMEPIKRGELRPIAVSTAERQATLPDVPTVQESGFGDFDIATMIGLQGPRGMSPAVVATLQKAVADVLREPEMLSRMEGLGMSLAERGTQNYVQFMKDDLARYQAAVKETGLTIQ